MNMQNRGHCWMLRILRPFFILVVSLTLYPICYTPSQELPSDDTWSLSGLPVFSYDDEVSIPESLTCWHFIDGMMKKCDSIINFNPGAAIWLYGDPGSDIISIDYLSGLPIPTTIGIALKSGWNLFSTPFDKDLEWNDSVLVNGQPLSVAGTVQQPYSYDGSGYVQATSLTRGKGYIVYASSDATLTLNAPVGSAVSFELDFSVDDMVIDNGRNKMYVSNRDSKKLHVVNLDTGLVESVFDFAYFPEALVMSTDGEYLYVALSTQDFYLYRADLDQEGHIAEINLNTLNKTREIHITTDPYDIAFSNNKLIITSGSGQTTNVHMYRIDDDTEVTSSFNISASFNIEIHANGLWAYIFKGDTYKEVISVAKFNISGNTIDHLYMKYISQTTGLRCHPDGDFCLSYDGSIRYSSNVGENDLEKYDIYSNTHVNELIFDEVDSTIITLENTFLKYYNSDTFLYIGTINLFGSGDFIGISGDFIYVLRTESDKTYIDKMARPCIGCGSNNPPIAGISISPSTGGDTATNYTFDASPSSDTEDSLSSLIVRWDWDSDGEYDTDFSSIKTAERWFNLSGSKTVTVQVQDTKGLTATDSVTFDVVQGIDYGISVSGGIPYQFDFAASDILFDEDRETLYLLDKTNMRVYFVDVLTGLSFKYFQLQHIPHIMASNPDGSKLYVAQWNRDFDESAQIIDLDKMTTFIAEFDLGTESKLREFEIAQKTSALCISPSGALYISGYMKYNDNPMHYLASYSNVDGSMNGAPQPITVDEFLSMRIHPNNSWLYFDGSSSSFKKYDISGDTLSLLYWGGDTNGDGFRFLPDGLKLFANSGKIFNISSSQPTDLSVDDTLTETGFSDIAFDTVNNAIFTLEGNNIVYRNYNTYEQLGSLSTSRPYQVLSLIGDYLYVASTDEIATYIEVVQNPVAGNSPPTPHIAITPSTDIDTETDIQFDASGSTDAEDETTALQVRWDWDSDGTYDTDFTTTKTETHRFIFAGNKIVSIQIKDSQGLTTSTNISVDVSQGTDEGVAVSSGTAWQVDFVVKDIAVDTSRSTAYLLDEGRKRIYVYNLSTGQVEKYFQHTYKPVAIAINPSETSIVVGLDMVNGDGCIAEIDAATKVKTKDIKLDVSPYDIQTGDSGRIYLTGNHSPSWYIEMLDTDGSVIDKEQITSREHWLLVNWNETRLYTAIYNSWPRSIEMYSLSSDSIVYQFDNHDPPDPTYVFGSELYLSSNEFYLLNNHVEAWQPSTLQNLMYVTDSGVNNLVFDDLNDRIYMVDNFNLFKYSFLTGFSKIETIALPSPGEFVRHSDSTIFVLRVNYESQETYFDRFTK